MLMKAHDNQYGFTRTIVVTIIVLVIVVVAISIYFLFWRSSANSYAIAIDQVKSLQKSVDNINTGLPIIAYAGNLNDTRSLGIQSTANSYQQTLQTLEKNVAINRNKEVKSAFAQSKEILESYGDTFNNISTSIKLYVAVLDSCTKFASYVNSTSTVSVSMSNQLSNTCLASIDNGKKSVDTAFNSQFFNTYLADLSSYISGVNNYLSTSSVADKASIQQKNVQIYTKIQSLGNSKINYSLQDPSSSLSQLLSVLNSQK